MTERAEDLQLEALRAFTLLSSLRDNWGGALVVACGLGPGGAALSIAANMACAGCIIIDPRTEVCRAALRSGACDFVVNTVDEALRILKNALREIKPVSVALTLSWAAALAELVDRGVLPELFTAFRDEPEIAAANQAARSFMAYGTNVVDYEGLFSPSSGAIDASVRLEEFTQHKGFRVESFTFSSAEALKAFDDKMIQTILPGGDPRQRWWLASAMFFYRERPRRRVLYLTADERERLGSGTNFSC